MTRRKTLVLDFVFNKVARFYTFFTEHLRTASSGVSLYKTDQSFKLSGSFLTKEGVST